MQIEAGIPTQKRSTEMKCN